MRIQQWDFNGFYGKTLKKKKFYSDGCICYTQGFHLSPVFSFKNMESYYTQVILERRKYSMYEI